MISVLASVGPKVIRLMFCRWVTGWAWLSLSLVLSTLCWWPKRSPGRLNWWNWRLCGQLTQAWSRVARRVDQVAFTSLTGKLTAPPFLAAGYKDHRPFQCAPCSCCCDLSRAELRPDCLSRPSVPRIPAPKSSLVSGQASTRERERES